MILRLRIELMLAGELLRDQELRGGLCMQYRVPDAISCDYRLIAYRFGKPVGGGECEVLSRILSELVRDTAVSLDAEKFTYVDASGRPRHCRVWRWNRSLARPEAVQARLPLLAEVRYE